MLGSVLMFAAWQLSILTCQIEEHGFPAKGIQAFQSYVCCLSVQHFGVGKCMFINRVASDKCLE